MPISRRSLIKSMFGVAVTATTASLAQTASGYLPTTEAVTIPPDPAQVQPSVQDFIAAETDYVIPSASMPRQILTQLNCQPAVQSRSDLDLVEQPRDGDVRIVLSESIMYMRTGSEWTSIAA